MRGRCYQSIASGSQTCPQGINRDDKFVFGFHSPADDGDGIVTVLVPFGLKMGPFWCHLAASTAVG